jgi:3-isopropylmalate/(R)-2-methylmalate dehydratase large subunit
MNIIEKILYLHSVNKSGKIEPGDIVRVKVDFAVLLDMAGLHPEFLRNPPKSVFDPDKVAIIFDHLVPAPTTDVADGNRKIRKLVQRWGVKNFYDYGRGGISHALLAQEGFIRPGMIIANTDSHTIAMGAYNSLGRGLGMPELMQVLCTGETWYIVGNTIKVNLNGKLPLGTEAKDVFLKMAQDIGDATDQNIEFHGTGIESLSIDERAVISTMCAELGAEFVVFPYDSVLQKYMEEKGSPSHGKIEPEPDATYKSEYDISLSNLEPMVALPDFVSRNIRAVADLGDIHIDQATIGSCANGRLHDLEIAARILKGRKISRDTRLVVTPATQEIYRQALELGYVKEITEAGGIVTNATCGSCFGGHMGLLGDNEVGITSTTRNFKGRMGSRSASIYLASSATVAASAIESRITDPRKYLRVARDVN